LGPLLKTLGAPRGDSLGIVRGGLPRTRRVLQFDKAQRVRCRGIPGVRAVPSEHLSSKLDEVVDLTLLEDDEEHVQ
jgi:hypothetical protein